MRGTPRPGPRVGRHVGILPAGPERFVPQMDQILAASLLWYAGRRGRGRAKGRGLDGSPVPSLCGLCCRGCRSFGRPYPGKPLGGQTPLAAGRPPRTLGCPSDPNLLASSAYLAAGIDHAYVVAGATVDGVERVAVVGQQPVVAGAAAQYVLVVAVVVGV